MEPEAASHYLGKVLAGRYITDRLIGQGSFAWVFHAYSESSQEVAIKVLHSTEPTARVRFAREIQVLRSLPNNPSVVQYVTHGQTPDGWPLVVLEYVDGITLKEGMSRCVRLETSKAVAFLSELCQAFIGLHQLGVAHRDVKPENILLARQGGIKLIDFGLIRDAQGILKFLEGDDPLERRIFEDELDQHILVGTPEYMAPEQFDDASADNMEQWKTDTWSDIFSLGVILYQLLAGEKAFPMRVVPESEYHREMYRYVQARIAMTDADLPSCAGIDLALESIVHKAMRRDPRQRQPDARVLHEDLQRYLETGQGIQEQDDSRTFIVNINSILPSLGRMSSNTPQKERAPKPAPPQPSAPSQRVLPPISIADDEDEATVFSAQRPDLFASESQEQELTIDALPDLVDDEDAPQGHTVIFFLDENGDPAASSVPDDQFACAQRQEKARPSIEPPPPPPSYSTEPDPWTQLELESAASRITGAAPQSGTYDIDPEPWSSVGHSGSARYEIQPPDDAPSPFDEELTSEDLQGGNRPGPVDEEQETKHPTSPFPGALPRSESIALAQDELEARPENIDLQNSFYRPLGLDEPPSQFDISIDSSPDYLVEEPVTWQEEPRADSEPPQDSWAEEDPSRFEVSPDIDMMASSDLGAYENHPTFGDDDEPTNSDTRASEEVTRQVDVRSLVPNDLVTPDLSELRDDFDARTDLPQEVTRRVDIAELVPGEFRRKRGNHDDS